MNAGDRTLIAPTGEEYSHDDNIEVCPVCKSRDRDLIESLCASGASVKDLAVEFAFKEATLQRHEAIHSTKPPNVDPMAILRHLRWLQTQADAITKRLFNGQTLSNNRALRADNLSARIKAIDLSLRVADKMIDLTGAKKYMDPHVILPRWNQIMSQLAEALQDNPSAIETLIAFMQQNAPEGTVAEIKAKRVQKYGHEIPLDYGAQEGTDGTEYSRDKMSKEELKKVWARNKPQPPSKPKRTPDEAAKMKQLAEARRQVRLAGKKANSEKAKARWKHWKETNTVPPTMGLAFRQHVEKQKREAELRKREANLRRIELRKLRSNKAAPDATGAADNLLPPPSGV